jgi:hypothetical protein
MFPRFYTLLLVLVVACASWAAFGAGGGMAASMILLALAIQIWAGKFRGGRPVRIVAGVFWLLALVCLLLPAIKAARDNARCMLCMSNLRVIGVALQNYRACYGCYPPPCTYDAAGRPMHSWRLLITPFLATSPIYNAYHLNEAWDGPSNRKVMADHYPCIYACPMVLTWPPGSNTTSYVALVGRRAAWAGDKDASRENHNKQEHAADTFLVIEMADSKIQWTEPKDVRFDDVQALRSLAANSPHLRNNGYFYRETPGVNAVLVDGDRIFMFPYDSTPDVLAALLPPKVTEDATRRDKHDPLDDPYTEKPRIHWPHCIGLPVWIVAAGLLFYQVMRSYAASGGHVKASLGQETKEPIRTNEVSGVDLS